MTLANIVGYGARSAVGNNALQCMVCARAGKLEPRTCYVRDKRRRPVGICLCAGLPAFHHGYDRLVDLAALALPEAMHGVTHTALPAVVALPTAGRPDDDDRFAQRFVEDLAARSGVSLDVGASQVVRRGYAGMAYALTAAVALMDAGAPGVIVGGVDSYYHAGVLSWLDDACRLHSLDAMDGFIPAEGAAFWVLRNPADTAAETDAFPPSKLRLALVRTGDEVVEGDAAPNVAATMSNLLTALRHDWVLTDDNGERHRSREWLAASMRWSIPFEHQERGPSLFGDVGAATGALLGVYVAEQLKRGCARATSALIALHSDAAERGVIALEAADA